VAQSIPAPTATSSSGVRLPTGQVAKRYGRNPRTIERWEHSVDLAFPRPLVINKRKYWSLEELEAWERARAALTAA
jgi:hypothetical protein